MKNKIKMLGLMVCLAIGSTSFAQKAEQPDKKGKKKARIEKLKSELELSEEQVERVKAVLKDQKEERKELAVQRKEINSKVKEEKEGIRIKTKELRSERDAAFSEILSKEQYEKYKAMGEKEKERKIQKRRVIE